MRSKLHVPNTCGLVERHQSFRLLAECIEISQVSVVVCALRIQHFQQGSTATENIQAAIGLSMLMEAANRSAKSNQPVRLDMLTR